MTIIWNNVPKNGADKMIPFEWGITRSTFINILNSPNPTPTGGIFISLVSLNLYTRKNTFHTSLKHQQIILMQGGDSIMQNAGKDKKGWRKDKLIRIEFNFCGVRLCSISVHYRLPYHYLCM